VCVHGNEGIDKMFQARYRCVLDRIHQFLFYGSQITLVDGNINAMKRNVKVLLDINKDTGLELHAEETLYMFFSSYHKTGQNYNYKMANISFENMAE
jgi:hypothetical protein